jgi:hypothetical protein
MKLKKGVTCSKVQPQLLLALQIINSVFTQHICELTITSLDDGVHKKDSKHYLGLACDCRTRDLKIRTLIDIVEDLRNTLGEDFDVVVEKDHLHIEYDPKEKQH